MADLLRILIVDDEPLIREGLREVLTRISDVVVIGDECGDGIEAVKAIRCHSPDVIFLDVEMPGLNGFEVINQLNPEEYGTIVFVTAFDEYAVRAFEVNAVDYLLKPFDEERVHLAVKRVRERLGTHNKHQFDEKITRLLEQFANKPDYAERFLVTSNGRTRIALTKEIEWIEAADNYVCLHLAGSSSALIRETMKSIEKRLNPKHFARVHRSAIVKLTQIKEFQSSTNGDYILTLQNGRKLTLSRLYRDDVFKKLI
jgi:two-component system LytT family response regulator